ncbi:thiamine pyrophosphate-binding protein [Microvirga sp. 17 mud 1-3]|uniref:thiamine pyrophosphate-binding protein n=1 Tax=Microvirga sp. 17 mud 1-3 TaxID=2082949 RepID=UPI000D6AECD9|nr:thiamine pyrophosphate-binding protein [Microvirga sp. 17 mud 1-3]AWM88577.1 thiamine pyrophosphate-binding protein [Microvirga sp. 17 mud 1-3]
MTAPSRTGGQILVDQLLVHGVDHIFCVPGESYLAALDALHDADINVTVCRQEGGAAMMAEAYGKLTGRPGICFVTRGPGATNASPGLHIAKQDSTPMILFVGQIERGMREREAFQELDYRAAFGAMVKWATEVDDPARFPEIVSRAFHVATSGRPGPVVIALPEDVLTEVAAVADAPRYAVVESSPAPEQMAHLQELLQGAERPIVLLGGSRWSKEAAEEFARFAADFKVPVACTFRRQMLFSADHPSYAGDLGLGVNPKLVERIRDADLILLVGGRLSEIPSQSYTLLDIPAPKQKLVHVHPDPSELGRVYSPSLAINASPAAFVSALKALKAPASVRWSEGTEALHASYLSWSDPTKIRHPGNLQMGEVMALLREALPADTIFCNGAGNFATWIHRFWPFRHYGTQLAPTSGSMGYGVPAAVGAKRIQPNSPVVVFAGDGDFLMNGQEFATAVQYDLPILVVLLDNGMYGTIRMHQEREYPGRVSATMLKNPDFAAYAKAFGGYGERVETTEEFGPALERALTSSKPAILHCILDPEAITPSLSLSQIREKALASRA